MAQTQIPASAFDFLKQLRENNGRNWFAANKTRYQNECAQMAAFADNLLQELNSHDVIETAAEPKAFTVFIGISVFQKIKRLTVPIGVAGSGGRASSGAGDIITILSRVIKVLYCLDFGVLTRRI